MSADFNGALSIFKKAQKFVPAYADFLSKQGLKPNSIKNAEDFKKVPVMDKKSYIYNYSLKELLPKGQIPPMAYASSGSSGKPTFWFREDRHGDKAGQLHYDIFNKVFGISEKDSVLVVICFSMGAWVAGNFTLEACRHVYRMGYKKMTIVTPGIEKEDIINILKNLAPQYENVILAGYPPFLMDVISVAKSRKVPIPKSIYALTAGDKFSESWRSAFLEEIKQKDPWRVVNVYGCADAGILGYETRFSIMLRREADHNKQLYSELFGEDKDVPAFVQYSSDHVYFEKVDNELVLTSDTAIPLVRYNIHDIGEVYTKEYIVSTKEYIVSMLKRFNLGVQIKRYAPKGDVGFLVKKGRTDVAVTYYALNIYPENIKAAIDSSKFSKYLSGNYVVYSKPDKNQKNERLYFEFEMAENVKHSVSLATEVSLALSAGLSRENMEYRKLRNSLGPIADPVVILTDGLTPSPRKSLALLNIKGKKPRMVLATA
jgi:phenylacetate-CoA ligase